MRLFLGIDLGASSLKACVIDDSGKRRAMTRAAVKTLLPAPGHVEQDPHDWRMALDAALQALSSADRAQIAGICFSGGAHIGALCDAQARPLQNAIMWADQRAAAEAEKLAADGKVETISGNRPNATWTLPQLIWLGTHRPDIVAATEKLFFAKDWLAYQLTGVFASDTGEAVGSLMADKKGDWDDELVALSGLDRAALPPLYAPMHPVGAVSSKAAKSFGLPENTPVFQGTIDTSMEWLCTPQSDDMASVKLASAGVLAFSTRDALSFPPISFYPHVRDGLFYHAAGMSDCMGALEWVRQNFTPQWDMAHFAEAADEAGLGADGLLFYPYLSGARAPFWDAQLKAELYGLTRAHKAPAIARAAFEGVGHVLHAIWDDMSARLAHQPDRLHVLGGGAEINFFCQMLADMMNVPLYRGGETDCAFAAALCAATAGGAFTCLSAAAEAGHVVTGQFVPDTRAQEGYALTYERFMARHAKMATPQI